jgi:hypothetical protein
MIVEYVHDKLLSEFQNGPVSRSERIRCFFYTIGKNRIHVKEKYHMIVIPQGGSHDHQGSFAHH